MGNIGSALSLPHLHSLHTANRGSVFFVRLHPPLSLRGAGLVFPGKASSSHLGGCGLFVDPSALFIDILKGTGTSFLKTVTMAYKPIILRTNQIWVIKIREDPCSFP